MYNSKIDTTSRPTHNGSSEDNTVNIEEKER